MDILSLVASVFTIIALCLAVYQTLMAFNQGKQAKDQAGILEKAAQEVTAQSQNVEQISQSLSTRYINDFPGYMLEVTQLIDDAKTSIHILCDFPGYCIFSDRPAWVDYHQSLTRKRVHGINVKMICLNQAKRQEWIIKQFVEAKDDAWVCWKEQSPYKERLEKFCSNDTASETTTPDTISYDELISRLETANNHLINDDFKVFDLHEVDGFITTHLWIRDEQEAFFAIPSLRQGDKAVGFHTHDAKLVNALLEIYNNYQASSTIQS